MFILSENSPLPLYKQLYNQIREQILSGSLAADHKLPSVRELAGELSASRNTVEAAYQELYAEGFIYSRDRSGYFVSPLEQEAAAPARVSKPLRRPEHGKTRSMFAYDFHPARLDPGSFPTSIWRRCYLDALSECAAPLAEYADPQGEWTLRSNIRQYLERSRGVVCTEEQIIVTAGLQHSLELLCHLVRDRHGSVAVEDPGYHLPRSVFCNNGLELSPLAATPGGIDIDRLKTCGSTMVYVTPSHQLPLGYVMPVANRLKLIEWAESGGNLIIEDDYDSELRYHGKPISSLQGLRPDGNIVYLGTFSKVLSPALRLSYLVLPRLLLPEYRRKYGGYFASVPLLEQTSMAKFMEQGHWERHVRRMRALYGKKHDTLLDSIRRHFGDTARVIGAGAGLHVVLELMSHNPGEAEILRQAAERGIRLFPFSAMCAVNKPAQTLLLLGFGAMAPARIAEGVALLAGICSQERR